LDLLETLDLVDK
jgi:hypothetical protein